MNRRLLGFALLLSVGVNVGILVMVWRRTSAEPPPPTPAPVVTPFPTPAPPPSLPAEPAPSPEPRSTPPEEPPPRPAPPPREERPPARPPEEAAEPDLEVPLEGPAGPLRPRPGVAPRLELLADELGLEGESRERFSTIQREFLRGALPLRVRLRAAEAEMRRELFAREPDRLRIAEIQDRIDAARRELETLLIDTVLRSRQLLDPAQDALYLRVVGRLRQATLGGPAREAGPRRPLPPDERPFRRRLREPRRPPG